MVIKGRVLKYLCVFLTACMMLSACSGGASPTEPSEITPPTETTVPAAPTEVTEAPAAPVPDLVQVIRSLSGTDGAWVELYRDGTLAERYYKFNLSNMYMEEGTPLTEPADISGTTQWVRFARDDGTAELTVYAGQPDMVYVVLDGKPLWYSAVLPENPDYALYNVLMNILAGDIRNLHGRIRFACDGTAEQVLERYITTEYADQSGSADALTKYGFSDFKALSWDASESRNNLIVGTVSYAIQYKNPGLAAGLIIDGGTETPGTGEYEGWHIITRQVILEKHSDGLWYEVDNNDYHVATEDWDGSETITPEAIADAEQFLTTVQLQAEEMENDLAALSDLFLRTARAVALTGRENFDWSWICTEEAFGYLGMQSLMNRPTVLYSEYTPGFISLEEDLAIVYHYEAILYFRQVDGKWLVEDIVRPFAGT